MVSLNFAKPNLDKSALLAPSVSCFAIANSLLIGIWEDKSLVEVSTHGLNQLYKLKSYLDFSKAKNFNVVHTSALYVHIDYDSFDPLDVKKYFASGASKLDDKIVEYEKLKQQKIFTLSAISKKLNSDLDSSRISFKKYHVSTALANTLLDGPDQMLVLITEKQIQLAIQKDKSFQLYSQEKALIANDFLYYILLAAKRLNIKITDFPVSIGGSIDESSPLYTLLKSYIPHMEFFSSSKFKVDGSSQPFHYYLPLIIARACG